MNLAHVSHFFSNISLRGAVVAADRMRAAFPLGLALLLPLLALGPGASAACPPQPTHTVAVGMPMAYVWLTGAYGAGVVSVTDTNAEDCDGDPVTSDSDGDMDLGVGGGAFGWGRWANDETCGFAYNVHGPRVVGKDVLGRPLLFYVAEDDQDGPVVRVDEATGETVCETNGVITPEEDPDDCTSGWQYGVGRTCGTGGGDGLYWVFVHTYVDLGGYAADGTVGTLTAGPDA